MNCKTILEPLTTFNKRINLKWKHHKCQWNFHEHFTQSPCKWFECKEESPLLPPHLSRVFITSLRKAPSKWFSIFNELFLFSSNLLPIQPQNVNNTTLINVLHSLGGSKDVEYRLAQSGDATCSGLENSEYGSRIMTLKRFGPAERCDFPKWFKEPKHWHSLNGELSYNVHQK